MKYKVLLKFHGTSEEMGHLTELLINAVRIHLMTSGDDEEVVTMRAVTGRINNTPSVMIEVE